MGSAHARKVGGGADVLVAGGNLLALVTVMLPAAGFFTRLIAFGTFPAASNTADTVAWSAPISQLAYTGFPSVLLALGITAVVGVDEAILRRIPYPKRGPLGWLGPWLALCLFALFLLPVVVLVPWPYGVLIFAAVSTGVGLAVWGKHLRGRGSRLTLRHGWMMAMPVVVASSLIFGFEGAIPGVTTARYTFGVDAQLQDGWFVQIGDNGSVVLLERCGSSSVLIAVNRAEVLSETSVMGAPTQIGPSVVGMFVQKKPSAIGYQPPC
jgi:hypothetical protein